MPEPNRRLVYSTDTGDSSPTKSKKTGAKGGASPKVKSPPTLNPANKTVYVERDRKGRGGKTVTVITNLQTGTSERTALLKKLKGLCGAGGTLKDDALEIQGDHREKVIEYLRNAGYQVKPKGG